METSYKNIHQEIIDQCRAGDRKAQSKLYCLYYKTMYSISLRIVNDSTEAEDVMQESFLSAFRNINSFRGEVSFGAWMKKIVINRSLDVLKKRKVKFVEMSEKTNWIPDTSSEITEVNTQILKNAINSLPDNYRTILCLFMIEGYDHEEISKSLGISNSSSRVQLVRAKQKLKDILRGKEIYTYN